MMGRYEVHYVGTLENGYEFANTWVSGRAVEVVPGRGAFLPAFEGAVENMSRGERRIVTIPAEQAYGKYDEDNVVVIPVSAFGGNATPHAGSRIEVRTAAGPARVKVVSVDGDAVTIDCNHELAGHDITFDIEVIADGTETNIERELEATGGCSCGCDRLKEQLDPEAHSHHHKLGNGGARAHGHERAHENTPSSISA